MKTHLFCGIGTSKLVNEIPNNEMPGISDSYFSNIDADEKAYILGWIASNGLVSKKGFSISVNMKDIDILYSISNYICKNLPISLYGNKVALIVDSNQISCDICKHLLFLFNKKSNSEKFSFLKCDKLKWAFIRGFFDASGIISDINSYPKCNISNPSNTILTIIYEFVSIPGYLGNNKIEWNGNNALDFLGNIYNNVSLKSKRKYEQYIDWCLCQPNLLNIRSDKFKWTKTDKDAFPPLKSRVSDAGYDITIIKKAKVVGDVEFYDTGIKIQPDFGYYFDLVLRSSISKTGYMLANCVGVIDRTYIGPVLVALRKVDKTAPDIDLPCRIAQIIPRHIVHLQAIEVDELCNTDRGSGGFGSTGV